MATSWPSPRESPSPDFGLTQSLAELGGVAAHVVKVHCVTEHTGDGRAGGDEGDLACAHGVYVVRLSLGLEK